MDSQEFQLKELVSEVALKNKRAYIISMIISGAILLIGVVWLWYSFAEVRKLQKTSDDLTQQIADKNKELKLESEKVEEAKRILDVINPMLKQYGVLKEPTIENLNSDLVKQSLEANQEIQKASASGNKTREKLTVLYYLKDVDAGKVETALKEVGYNVKIATPIRPDLPSNLIGFGKDVSVEDAKLATYILMRAGVEIKEICRSVVISKSSIIQVLGAENLLNKPSLTVEQVQNKTVFPPCSQI